MMWCTHREARDRFAIQNYPESPWCYLYSRLLDRWFWIGPPDDPKDIMTPFL